MPFSVFQDRVPASSLMAKTPGKGRPNAVFRSSDFHRNCPCICSYTVVNECITDVQLCICTIVRIFYKDMPLFIFH